VKSTGRGITDNYLFYSCVMDVKLIIYTTSSSASIGWGTRCLGWCILCSMLVVGSGRCSMLVAGKLKVKVSRFGGDENRAVEFDIRGVVCFVREQDFSQAPINSAVVIVVEEVKEFGS
jgi:hypothetical protein